MVKNLGVKGQDVCKLITYFFFQGTKLLAFYFFPALRIFKFIFGCAGSSLLHGLIVVASLVAEHRLISCGARI